jgi:hypothetical protein
MAPSTPTIALHGVPASPSPPANCPREARGESFCMLRVARTKPPGEKKGGRSILALGTAFSFSR